MEIKMGVMCFLLTAALAGACQVQRGQIPVVSDTAVGPLFWPRPPLQPRIRFLKAVARPTDLGIQRSFWQQAWDLIVGKEEEWFIRPTGVAVRGSVIYVADPGAQAMWILDATAGQFKKIQEAEGHPLLSPAAVTLGPEGHVYLADSYLRRIFVFDREGHQTRTISHADFQRPSGLAYDVASDRLYAADSAAHRVWIFTGDGRLVRTIGQRGIADGEFNFPTHLTLDRKGTLYVTDALGFRVQLFSSDGKFLGRFGRHGDTSGDFASPRGVAVDSEGHIYVVEALFDAVQIFDRQGQYLLTFGERGLGPGQFWLPTGLFIDPQGQIYVADSYNQRIQVFQYLAGGGG